MMRPVSCRSEGTSISVEEESVQELFLRLDEWNEWNIPGGELSVLFAGDEETSRLHGDFFGDSSVTDVMTFPGDVEEDHAGDIAVCPEFGVLQADRFGQTIEDELTLYLVHGWLHLAGLEDATEAGRRQMREEETRAMQWLGEFRIRLKP